MQIHLSFGVAAIVAHMQTHRIARTGLASHIDDWHQTDMLLANTEATQPAPNPPGASHGCTQLYAKS
jgi:hypothetical protein